MKDLLILLYLIYSISMYYLFFKRKPKAKQKVDRYKDKILIEICTLNSHVVHDFLHSCDKELDFDKYREEGKLYREEYENASVRYKYYQVEWGDGTIEEFIHILN